MRILGLDYGERRIGVALSDPLSLTAQGLEVIERTSLKKDLAYIRELVLTRDVQRVVVGLPRSMDGSIGTKAKETLSFVERLKNQLLIPVVTYDERLSTVEAERSLISSDVSRKKRKRVMDKVAAVIILQGYLDRMKREEEKEDG